MPKQMTVWYETVGNANVRSMRQENIRATYLRATEEMRIDGAAWYPGMLAIMRAHSEETGLPVISCAAVYAATSINTQWSRNLALASRFLADMAAGIEAFSNLKTLGDNVEKVFRAVTWDAIAIMDSIVADPDNLKIRNFIRNLSGDYDAVTVDRWAMRIAYGTLNGGYVPTGDEYREIAEDYRIVAAEFGISPAELQAVTWCVIRGTGE